MHIMALEVAGGSPVNLHTVVVALCALDTGHLHVELVALVPLVPTLLKFCSGRLRLPEMGLL